MDKKQAQNAEIEKGYPFNTIKYNIQTNIHYIIHLTYFKLHSVLV